ncbi:MAG: efflux RND transporter periplasmic adaptor subunit [Desulfobacteraceae bacterium]
MELAAKAFTMLDQEFAEMFRPIKFSLFVIAGLLLTLPSACGSPGDKKVDKAKPRPVRVATIQSRDLPILVRSVGRLVPDREVVLSAQVTGIVMELKVDVGDRVTSGATLVRLDPTDYTLALSEAQANQLAAQARLCVADKNFSRAKRLLPEKAISRELFDAAEAEYRTAQALVSQSTAAADIARQRLNKTTVCAPFGGHVVHRYVELGQNVAVGEAVIGIADMQAMRVKIHISENDYLHLDMQDPVSVVVEAFSDQPYAGRVDKIGIQADARTNTFEVEILLDNPRYIFKAGLTARVAIQTEVIHQAVIIPQGSVLFREDRKEVFVVEQGGHAAVREVKLGETAGSDVRILQGLKSGDVLVVAGAQYLKPGDRVAITQ